MVPIPNTLAKRIIQKLYNIYAIRKNVNVGRRVHIGIWSRLWAPKCLKICDDVYIGKFCTIECDGIIGNDVMIANNVGLIGRYDHDFKHIGLPIRKTPWIGDKDYQGPGKNLQIIIENDVWIGFGAVLISGIIIGRGAIVGAGAIVTKDIEPYSIVVGNPAKSIGSRFTFSNITIHERILRKLKTGKN